MWVSRAMNAWLMAFHRDEEAPAQISRRLRRKKGAIEPFVFRPDGTHVNSPPVLQRQVSLGALVRRGEAVAQVTATGADTKFGRTAELVRTAHVVSSQQKAVLRVVRYLAGFNGVVIVLLVIYASFLKKPLAEIIPLVLTAVLASIPVALPATFTLASADRVSTLRRSPQGPRRSG
jgi:magnesium-transporting ATPase (P-type)